MSRLLGHVDRRFLMAWMPLRKGCIVEARLRRSGRSFGRRGRTNLYFAAILEVDGRSEHHLVALLDALADLDLGSQVANFGDLAAVHDAILYDEHMETVAVEDDRPRRHDQ